MRVAREGNPRTKPALLCWVAVAVLGPNAYPAVPNGGGSALSKAFNAITSNFDVMVGGSSDKIRGGTGRGGNDHCRQSQAATAGDDWDGSDLRCRFGRCRNIRSDSSSIVVCRSAFRTNSRSCVSTAENRQSLRDYQQWRCDSRAWSSVLDRKFVQLDCAPHHQVKRHELQRRAARPPFSLHPALSIRGHHSPQPDSSAPLQALTRCR